MLSRLRPRGCINISHRSCTSVRWLATQTTRSPTFRFGEWIEGLKVERSEDSLQQVTGYLDAHIALRDACKCSQCIDQSTSQREYSFADIPLDIKGEAKQDESGNWRVHWSNDIPGFKDHVSVFSPAQLKQFRSTPRHTHKTSMRIWDAETLEQETRSVYYEDVMKSEDGMAELLYLLGRHGLVFVKGVPELEDSVTTLAGLIAPVRNTFYGSSWNVISQPQAKNVAYTSKDLGFHMDLLYLKESPTVQFLHCLENSCVGGESQFVDTLKAYDILCSENRELANFLRSTKIRYEYDNDGQYYTDVKPVIQSRSPMDIPRRKIIGHTSNAVEQVQRVYWSPPFVGSIWAELGEASEIVQKKIQASKAFAEILERPELVYEGKLEPGTCVVFDNLRVLHARKAFDMNSGKRWLRGCYLDGQDVLSKELHMSDRVRMLDKIMNESH